MLEINNLCIDFNSRHGEVKAVKDVSLSLKRGEILGVVGESGAGKSTVGAAIMDLLEGGGRVSGGQVLFDGEDLLSLNHKQMEAVRGRRIGMIFQNPLTALNPVRSVGSQLAETIQLTLGFSAAQARERAIDWMRRMQLPDPLRRIDHYPHEFSGGQRQRIVIALALCGEPDLVIADEPTTALDVSVQAEILGQIKTLVQETNIGVILITHNMGVVAEITDRVAIMCFGELVEIGPTSVILSEPQTAYAQMLIGSVPPSKFRLKRLPVPDKQGRLSPVVREPAKTHVDADEVMLSVKDVSVTYHTGKGLFSSGHANHALRNIAFDLKKGFSLGVVGESGSGKSTCARAVAGLVPISSGVINFSGNEISDMSESKRRPLRSAMQMIFQDPYSSVNPRLKIRDIIAEPIRFYGITDNRRDVDDRVEKLLSDVDLPADLMRRYPHQLSGGQRQRIAIARTLASTPSMIICDEPTSALDVSVQAQVLNLIKDLQDEHGLTLLFISHDLPVVRQMCDDILVLKDGAIVELAPTEQLFESPQNDYTHQLLKLMPNINSFIKPQL